MGSALSKFQVSVAQESGEGAMRGVNAAHVPWTRGCYERLSCWDPEQVNKLLGL